MQTHLIGCAVQRVEQVEAQRACTALAQQPATCNSVSSADKLGEAGDVSAGILPPDWGRTQGYCRLRLKLEAAL
ncbi:hypothetical protein GCM10027040_26330 [Halomonas shantousis]